MIHVIATQARVCDQVFVFVEETRATPTEVSVYKITPTNISSESQVWIGMGPCFLGALSGCLPCQGRGVII